ncbi:hypothetical protein ACFY3K_00660 [Staphylococcus capitis]|uniref:hypothetical protein n=1 Tax=Staphylococcus capitis TaxID=29388 RepID=UPI00369F2810
MVVMRILECCSIANDKMQLPASYYKDREDLQKRIREVDEKHTQNYNNLSLIIAELKPMFKQIIETNKEMNASQKESAQEQRNTNEHLNKQNLRITNLENNVNDLEEDTQNFKGYIEKNQAEASAKGKENKEFLLKAFSIMIGGGGIAYVIHPFFEILKTIFK